MAKLTKYAMENSVFREIFKTKFELDIKINEELCRIIKETTND